MKRKLMHKWEQIKKGKHICKKCGTIKEQIEWQWPYTIQYISTTTGEITTDYMNCIEIKNNQLELEIK